MNKLSPKSLHFKLGNTKQQMRFGDINLQLNLFEAGNVVERYYFGSRVWIPFVVGISRCMYESRFGSKVRAVTLTPIVYSSTGPNQLEQADIDHGFIRFVAPNLYDWLAMPHTDIHQLKRNYEQA